MIKAVLDFDASRTDQIEPARRLDGPAYLEHLEALRLGYLDLVAELNNQLGC